MGVLTIQIMTPAMKRSVSRLMATQTYKLLSSVHESVGDVKLPTTTAIRTNPRGMVIDMMISCITIAYKQVRLLARLDLIGAPQ